MFNLAVLTGRITATPELKTTTNGLSVCTFSIANDIGYGDNKKTSFIPIVAWRKTAEVVANNFSKGNLIGIEGSIQTRKYEDKNGNIRTVFEVVANNIQFLEPKKTNDSNDATDPLRKVQDKLNEFVEIEVDSDLPF
jgi:single-strand DNA-binding protein